LKKQGSERQKIMKKFIVFLAVALLFSSPRTFATSVFSDSFPDPNGALLGQSAQIGSGVWSLTSSTVNPIQVNNGLVVLVNSGQDAYDALSSPVSTSAGGSIFVGLDLNVTAAQATGDYFLHFCSTVGGTSGFYDKVWVKSSGSGFVLGSQDNNGTVIYGSTVLTLGTTYRLVTEEDFVPGALNDTFEFYVNPTDLSVAANNTAYLSATWSGAGAEASSYAEINLRQGTAAAAPSETIDNLIVGSAFSNVSVIPEPSTVALAAMGGVACLVAFRRSR